MRPDQPQMAMTEHRIIRKFTPADKEHVIRLLRLNTPRYFAPSEEAELADYLENHAGNYFLSEDSGDILGCGGFNLAEDGYTGRISWDIVHPDHHGRGIGAELLRHRITLMQQIPHLQELSVRTAQLTYGFYEQFGFELAEVIPDYWAPGFDLYHMHRPARLPGDSTGPR